MPFLVLDLGIPRFLRSFGGWVGRSFHLSFTLGRLGDPPLHPDQQLVVGQHLLPHDHRKPGENWAELPYHAHQNHAIPPLSPGSRFQAALRDESGLQDGRPAHQLHQPHAHQHEQAEVTEGQVMAEVTCVCVCVCTIEINHCLE